MEHYTSLCFSLFILIICIYAEGYQLDIHNGQVDESNRDSSYKYRSKYFDKDYHKDNGYLKKDHEITPPDHKKIVEMARYVVHNADWASIATISTVEPLRGFPFTNVASMCDGPVSISTGTPYFYLTPLDFTSRDLKEVNRCTISVTLETTGYCSKKGFEPDDPRCARVFLAGSMKRVDNSTQEHTFAQNALFSRHPGMKTLPADHEFYVAKLLINEIYMLDWFGGPKHIAVKDYFAYDPPETYLNTLFPEKDDEIIAVQV